MLWSDFIGQPRIVRELYATATSGWSGNILLRGNYGHGKTTLARLYLETAGQYYNEFSTPTNVKEITRRASQGNNLLVDEIHLLKKQEYLYEAMSHNVNIVFCTTDAGDLSEAFKSRCTELRLRPYRDSEITAIIYTTLARKSTILEVSQAEYLARRSWGNPRVALNLAERVYRMAMFDDQEFNLESIEDQLAYFGIDKHGYDDRHRAYITYLMGAGKPVSLANLCLALDLPQSDVRSEIESALIRNGHIEITSLGRRLK